VKERREAACICLLFTVDNSFLEWSIEGWVESHLSDCTHAHKLEIGGLPLALTVKKQLSIFI